MVTMNKSDGERLFEAVRDEVGPNASIYECWADVPHALRARWEAAAKLMKAE